MPERWSVYDRRVDHISGPFSLRRDRAALATTGAEHEFIILESPDWVNVVPLTADGRLILVRQHRLGTDSIELEIPGGLIDPEDASPQVAAQRELIEETGYRARSWLQIGEVVPNPALQNNRCYTLLATDCWSDGPPRPDEREPLEVVVVPLVEVPELIASGQIAHALALMGLFWYFLHAGYLKI
jgi:8-oxo-dGTP pyrophosphatase MutT (NUDIX family)